MCESKSFKVLGKRLNSTQGLSPKNKIGITTTIVKCRKCALIFSNPMPIPLDIDFHYGINPETYWKESYFDYKDNWFSDELKIINKLIEIKNKKALDIGTGIGKTMIALENAGFDTYGIEPSTFFFDKAINKMKINPSKLCLTTLEDAQFQEDEFDFITFGAVLEHLYYPSESIIKAMKWLKKGGLMHIEVPSSKWLTNNIINFIYKIKGLDYVSNISPMHIPYHLYEFDINSFKLNAIKNGYEVVYFEYFLCETYLPSFLDFIIRPIIKKTNKGMQLSVWLRKV